MRQQIGWKIKKKKNYPNQTDKAICIAVYFMIEGARREKKKYKKRKYQGAHAFEGKQYSCLMGINLLFLFIQKDLHFRVIRHGINDKFSIKRNARKNPRVRATPACVHHRVTKLVHTL